MNRRAFIETLVGAAAAQSLDWDRLLWTPKKTIFIPPAVEIVHVPLGVMSASDWRKYIALIKSSPERETGMYLVETISKAEFNNRYPSVPAYRLRTELD